VNVIFHNAADWQVLANLTNQTLLYQSSLSLRNDGLLRAPNGGILSPSTSITNTGGLIETTAASQVLLNGFYKSTSKNTVLKVR
jgi:hypothetical protein